MALGATATLIGSVLLIEGILAFINNATGDPKGDVQRTLEQTAIQSQLRASQELALEQQQEEELQGQFARFNRPAQQALSSAAILGSPGGVAGARGGQVVQGQVPQGTELLDLVSARVGLSPDELRSLTSSGRVGDLTSLPQAAGGPIPTR